MIRKQSRAAAVLAALVISVACNGRLSAPAQLSPIGDTAYYARHITKAIDTLQDVAKDGEASGVINREDARLIVEATVKSGKAAVDLAKALEAGASETTARNQAIAVIRQLLTDLPSHLSKSAADLISPYISVILTLLTVFGN